MLKQLSTQGLTHDQRIQRVEKELLNCGQAMKSIADDSGQHILRVEKEVANIGEAMKSIADDSGGRILRVEKEVAKNLLTNLIFTSKD